MAEAVPILRREERRHNLTNVGLIVAFALGATLITNERGVFAPVGIGAMSATAEAFASILAPPVRLVGAKKVVPLHPANVPAADNALRQALAYNPQPLADVNPIDVIYRPLGPPDVIAPPGSSVPLGPPPFRSTDEGSGGPVSGAVPEPAAWAMLIAGFGMIGFLERLRHRRRRAVVAD